MKGSKLLMSMLVVVLLLSVSVTTARADTPLPESLNGEEPDRHMRLPQPAQILNANPRIPFQER